MKAFKLFYKIVLKNMTLFIIQLIIFLTIFIVLFISFNKESSTEITVEKVPIMLINEDKDDPISNSLVQSLETITKIDTSIPDNPNSISDALFFEEIFYFLRIPKGFGESLRNNTVEENPLIVQKALEETTSETVNRHIQQYLSLYDVHRLAENGNIPKDKESSVLTNIENNFNERVKISFYGEENNRNQLFTMILFMNLVCYFLYVSAISEIGFAMVTMEDKTIRAREISSGYPQFKRSLGLYLASMLITFILWLIPLGLSYFFLGDVFFTTEKGQWLLLSSFFHMIAVGSISIFIGTIAPNKGFINFFSTVFGLFIGFSSGVFIPTDIIWEPMRKIAYFTPTIWHIELNELIVQSSTIDGSSFIRLVTIQLLMALAFFLLSLAYRRRKQFKGIA